MGFRRGTFEDKFAFFEASKNPLPKRRNLPIFISKKNLFERPFTLDRVNFSTPETSFGGWELNTNFLFSQTFRALPGYPGKIPGYPAKNFGFAGFRRTYRTFKKFFTPTPSRGRPPPHLKSSGPKSFGFGFFFLPWKLIPQKHNCDMQSQTSQWLFYPKVMHLEINSGHKFLM